MGGKCCRIEATKGKQLSCFVSTAVFTEPVRGRQCRRKAVRHDGGTGFRLAVDSFFSFVDFLQPLRFWLEEWYVTDLLWGYVSMLVI